MANRGPDATGQYHGRFGERQITLLHSRLSIIDLDARSHQPLQMEDCILVYNGEIYNYLELRRELEAEGWGFQTSSDTEVVLKAYRHWGADCFNRFVGMWAFALWDQRKDELVLSRDPFGEKPLFLRWDGQSLYFASEVKQLVGMIGGKPTVNLEQIKRYLVYGYKALYKHPRTYFTDFVEIPAAHYLVLGPDLVGTPKRYWSLQYRPKTISMDDAVEGAREALEKAVELRLRADVPLAFCLSGGVDSASLAAIAAKKFNATIHAFSIIDGDERYNESDNIMASVRDLGCDLHVVQTSTEGFLKRLHGQVAYHDAPVVTITYYVHNFLSEAIHNHGYKVAVSGTAADELFTGYYDHYSMWLAEMHDQPNFEQLLDDWRGSYGAYVRNPLLRDPMNFVKDPNARQHIRLNWEVFADLLTEPFEEEFEEETYSENLLRNRMLNELFHESTPVILREDDLNSMQYSVENRSPFLDRSLAEFCFSVPSRHLIHDGYPKWLLRAALDGTLNEQVRLDKRKRGFNASILSLLDRGDKDVMDQVLDRSSPIYDLVRYEAVADFMKGDMNANSFSKFLFSFLSAKAFLEIQRDGQG